jgi:outer membrane protein OmpA-like peptidoglycan-associated protein
MNSKFSAAVALALALAACASAPEQNAALERAQAQVDVAQSDPNVVKYAPLELEAAKKDLALAQSAAAHHKPDEVSQPAYMADQTARLAQLHAAAKADDAQVAAGQEERNRIQLAARTAEADSAKQQASRLQAEVDKLKATPTSRGLVLTLGDVLFDTGKATLNPGAAFKLDQLGQFLAQHPDRRVQIDGFTDSVGSDAYNEELSQRRADAVKTALLARGIDAARISTEGYGKAYPVATNNDSGGRQLNRRVEVVIGNDGNIPIAPRG